MYIIVVLWYCSLLYVSFIFVRNNTHFLCILHFFPSELWIFQNLSKDVNIWQFSAFGSHTEVEGFRKHHYHPPGLTIPEVDDSYLDIDRQHELLERIAESVELGIEPFKDYGKKISYLNRIYFFVFFSLYIFSSFHIFIKAVVSSSS